MNHKGIEGSGCFAPFKVFGPIRIVHHTGITNSEELPMDRRGSRRGHPLLSLLGLASAHHVLVLAS